MWYRWRRLSIVLLAFLFTGCSASRLEIPKTLEPQIDKTVTFADVLASPNSYKGRLIIIGGQLLKAERLKEWMQVELLQLPLNEDHIPTTVLTKSQGRVMALHQELLDPATLTPGMMVTFVGEVTGAVTEKLDEVDYRYPLFTVRHWHIWPPETFEDQRGASYFGVFGGVGIGGGSRGGGGGIGIGF